MELHQAIVKMEQGGSADGILQVLFHISYDELYCDYLQICLSLMHYVCSRSVLIGYNMILRS